MLPHPLGLFAIIFGILLAMRKLDVGHRMPEQFPAVDRTAFEGWKAQAMAAYGLGVWACFLKLVVDFVGSALYSRYAPSPALARTLGIGFDVAWVMAMFATWRRVRAAHAVAEKLGIEGRVQQDPESKAE